MVGMLNRADMITVARGAALFGSGGGGPLTPALRLLEDLPRNSRLEIRPVEDTPAEGMTVIIADMGAPKAMMPLTNADHLVAAFEQYCAQHSTPATAVMPIEVGCLNTVAPFFAALKHGLPVIDGDGAGRAIPSITQLTFAGHGLSTRPSVLADDRGREVSLMADNAMEIEAAARPMLAAAFNHQAGLALWGMDRDTLLKVTPIRGMIGHCLEVGRRMAGADPVDAVMEYLNGPAGFGGAVLCRGRLIDVTNETRNGFDYGRATLQDAEGTIRVYNQNENMIAWRDDQTAPMGVAPDILAWMTPDGRAFSNADIGPDLHGAEILLVRIPVRPALTAFDSVRSAFRDALIDLGYGGRLPFRD